MIERAVSKMGKLRSSMEGRRTLSTPNADESVLGMRKKRTERLVVL